MSYRVSSSVYVVQTVHEVTIPLGAYLTNVFSDISNVPPNAEVIDLSISDGNKLVTILFLEKKKVSKR